MNKKLFSLVALFILSFATVGAQTFISPTGTQKIGHYVLKLEDFSQLVVKDGVNINYKSSVDSAGMAVFDAPDNIASTIVFSPKKDKLTIQYDVRNEKYKNIPTITVYSKFLTSVENQADSVIRILNINSGPELKLKVVGNGKIVANNIIVNKLSANITTGKGIIVTSGQCGFANFSNYGAGQIQADLLKCDEIKCKLMGTGTIGCYPLKKLEAIGVGTGKVYYRGEPETIDKSTISTQVIQINAEDTEYD